MSINRGWWVVATLAVVQLACVIFKPPVARTTYVLTPVIDIVPGGSPLEATEAHALINELSAPQDIKNMEKAYAQLGSTLSLHDLIRGVESLSDSDAPLSPTQKHAIGALLKQTTEDHQELVQVQAQILDIERDLSAQVARMEMVPDPPTEGP